MHVHAQRSDERPQTASEGFGLLRPLHPERGWPPSLPPTPEIIRCDRRFLQPEPTAISEIPRLARRQEGKVDLEAARETDQEPTGGRGLRFTPGKLKRRRRKVFGRATRRRDWCLFLAGLVPSSAGVSDAHARSTAQAHAHARTYTYIASRTQDYPISRDDHRAPAKILRSQPLPPNEPTPAPRPRQHVRNVTLTLTERSARRRFHLSAAHSFSRH